MRVEDANPGTLITTRFALGDNVWSISRSVTSIRLPCRTCLGQGTLKADSHTGEKLVGCPDCAGNSLIQIGTWPQWVASTAPIKIGMIKIQVVSSDGEDNGHRADNMNPSRAARVGAICEERYMCWQTGVGSGRLYDADNLFMDPREALEAATLQTELARQGELMKDRGRWWPSNNQVVAARHFLDHRDTYVHDTAHVALAEEIIKIDAKNEIRKMAHDGS